MAVVKAAVHVDDEGAVLHSVLSRNHASSCSNALQHSQDIPLVLHHGFLLLLVYNTKQVDKQSSHIDVLQRADHLAFSIRNQKAP